MVSAEVLMGAIHHRCIYGWCGKGNLGTRSIARTRVLYGGAVPDYIAFVKLIYLAVIYLQNVFELACNYGCSRAGKNGNVIKPQPLQIGVACIGKQPAEIEKTIGLLY